MRTGALDQPAVHPPDGRDSAPLRRPWTLILLAVGFVALYLSTDFVVSGLASETLPLPNAPAGEARDWFVGNSSAAVMMGVCQLLSVLCLGGFALALRRTASSDAQTTALRKATPWGLIAVAAMAVSSVLAWLLVGFASTASLDTVGGLRTASFIAGGTAHVVVLGIFVLLASRTPGFGKAVRVFAIVAVVPAVASLVSLVVFQGAALILLGRLLCMIWTISAAVSVTRRIRRGSWT
jgi:hypothetical protein